MQATVGLYAPNPLGYTRATMVGTMGYDSERRSYPLNPIFSRLRVVIHPHDVGIPSNQTSSSSGEYVPAPCTHRPSNQPSRLLVRVYFLDKSESKVSEVG